jgi:hypothetical protein
MNRGVWQRKERAWRKRGVHLELWKGMATFWAFYETESERKRLLVRLEFCASILRQGVAEQEWRGCVRQERREAVRGGSSHIITD